MKETTVNRDKLLETLKKNRAKHAKEYERAMKNWLKRCRASLKHRLGWLDRPKFKAERYDLDFSELPKPVNYIKAYDQAIAQVEWEEEETIKLTEQDFKMFILDQWNWTEDFMTTTSAYNSKLGRPTRSAW